MELNEIIFECTKFDSNTTNIQDSKTAWTKRLLSAYTAYLYKIWAVIKTLYDILRRYLYLEHRKLVWMFCSLTFNLYWHIENISLALLSRYISIEYAILLHCKTNNNRNKLIVIILWLLSPYLLQPSLELEYKLLWQHPIRFVLVIWTSITIPILIAKRMIHGRWIYFEIMHSCMLFHVYAFNVDIQMNLKCNLL